MKLFALAAIVGLSVNVMASSAAWSADPDFCRDYARSAIDQGQRALSMRRCAYLVSGPRWSLDFRDHFNWCLGVHRHVADDERAFRHEQLEQCRFR
jgi:hypothetical protein